jgi:broad specificity phosphatase PhoE
MAANNDTADQAGKYGTVTLVRHGETEWSLDGRHTSVTDIPLTNRGVEQAKRLADRLGAKRFDLVVSSPRRRALDTAAIAGFGGQAEIWDLVSEWDYGSYEGITTEQIRRVEPGWNVFTHGAPGGETPEQVARRADLVIAMIKQAGAKRTVLFSHSHFLRVLGARWMELPASCGQRLVLATASISELGYERDVPALTRWNDTSHLG